MTERKGFYEHLQEVPNPHPEEKTSGSLEKFSKNAGRIAQEALRRTREQANVPLIEYEIDESSDEGEKR